MKSHQVGTVLFHADGRIDRQTDRQTDMTKLIVAFRNFANAPEIGKSLVGSAESYICVKFKMSFIDAGGWKGG
jgi:Fe-S-cluster formation regulator IscX/YfhJ